MAFFEKMKFEKIINGDDIQYFINHKPVEQEVYDTILLDDSLYQLPPLPKVNNIPENNSSSSNKVVSINKYSEKENEEECHCENCQELLIMINNIREMSDYDAKNVLSNYIEVIKTHVHMETLVDVYGEIGSSLVKHSGKLENQLEEFLEQFNCEDE
jgi:hypothetical protein